MQAISLQVSARAEPSKCLLLSLPHLRQLEGLGLSPIWHIALLGLGTYKVSTKTWAGEQHGVGTESRRQSPWVKLLHWELAHTHQQQLLFHGMGLLWGALCPASAVSAVEGWGPSATTALFPQLQGEWLQRQVRLLLTSAARKSSGIYFNWLMVFLVVLCVCVCLGFIFISICLFVLSCFLKWCGPGGMFSFASALCVISALCADTMELLIAFEPPNAK